MASMIQEKIKAGDLRIGNWIRRSENDMLGAAVVLQVRSLYDETGAFGDSINDSSPAMFEPIPLSEDWLIRMGFEKKYASKTRYYKLDLGIENCTLGFISGDDNDVYLFPNENIRYKYVHELQNATHSLTGKELKLNNEK